jgi:osmoprotectant transport system substrate-binding protein
VAAVVAALLPGCTAGPATPATPGTATVRIASFDFPESVLLAEIYGRALTAAGYRVTVQSNLGSREIVFPALEQGFVDLVPEYLGSALDFAGLGKVPATADQPADRAALAALLSPRGLDVLGSAPAQDQNAVVVTKETAARLDLRSISDLQGAAGSLVLGGPPECPKRPLCQPGLEHTYGLVFSRFDALDAAGDYTVNALSAGRIDVGVLFSTDGRIGAHQFFVLADDRGLQPAENVTPLVRSATVRTLGAGFVSIVDQVSAQLTTGELRAMNGRLADDPAFVVAARWLREHGLGH